MAHYARWIEFLGGDLRQVGMVMGSRRDGRIGATALDGSVDQPLRRPHGVGDRLGRFRRWVDCQSHAGRYRTDDLRHAVKPGPGCRDCVC